MKNGSMRTGRFTAMLAALACGSWGVGVASGQPQHIPTLFEDPEVFDVFVDYPYGIASGHLNGGNNLDLIVALNNSNPDPLAPWNGAAAVLLGRPDGTFQTPSADEAYLFQLGNQISGSSKVEIVDLNNDGFDDIVVANFYSDNISVLINNMLVTTGP